MFGHIPSQIFSKLSHIKYWAKSFQTKFFSSPKCDPNYCRPEINPSKYNIYINKTNDSDI